MKKYAVIAAGGSGNRMGLPTRKQFLLLHNKPVLWHTIQAFINAFPDINFIIVVPTEVIDEVKEICSGFDGDFSFTSGGNTRFQSVKNGLKLVTEDSIVFVHDAVRCLIEKDLLERCYHQALELGSAVPAIELKDSVRIIENGHNKVIDRRKIRIIQTPQTFKSQIILPAFDVVEHESFTDEATVVEASGFPVYLVEGEQTNIKITYPQDLLLAEKILIERSSLNPT